MPFVRFSRDKRGYEHVYLVHATQGRGRSGPARVLYWYRTPPGVKVGREPFDESVRRALEAEYPNLEFDWNRIINTPAPPPEAENWREKRRLMKEMRAARAAEPSDEPAEEASKEGRAEGVSRETASAPAGPDAGPNAAPEGQARRRRRRGGRRRREGGNQPVPPGQPPVDASAANVASDDGAPHDVEPDSPGQD